MEKRAGRLTTACRFVREATARQLAVSGGEGPGVCMLAYNSATQLARQCWALHQLHGTRKTCACSRARRAQLCRPPGTPLLKQSIGVRALSTLWDEKPALTQGAQALPPELRAPCQQGPAFSGAAQRVASSIRWPACKGNEEWQAVKNTVQRLGGGWDSPTNAATTWLHACHGSCMSAQLRGAGKAGNPVGK